MIVFDLEWTQPFGQDSMEEIIQIGAVRIGELGGPIMDCFTGYIKPVNLSEVVADREASAGRGPFDGFGGNVSGCLPGLCGLVRR